MTAPTSAAPLLLRPALVAVTGLRTGSRLAVVVALLLVPGLVASSSYASALGGQIAFSSAERDGVEVLVPTLLAMADALGADDPATVDIDALVAAAGRHPDIVPDADLDAVRTTLDSDAAATPGGRLATAVAFQTLATTIGNNSNLILDPDLDSFYVMDALTVQVPKALVAVAGLAAPVGDGANPDAIRAVQVGALDGAGAAVESDLATTLDATAADIGPQLAPLQAAAADVRGAAAEMAAGSSDMPAALVATLRDAVEPAAAALDGLLADRISGLETSRARTLAIVAAGFACAVYVAAAVWWRTRHDVGTLVRTVRRIADGGEDLAAGTPGDPAGDPAGQDVPNGRDEFGDIGRAVLRTRQLVIKAQADVHQREQERGAQARLAMMKQKEAEQLRLRAQSIISETADSVVAELHQIVEQVAAMRSAADAIETHVAEADRVTDTVVSQAHDTDEVVETLGGSLRRVAEMAQLIAGVAGQSKLLALNATIEAVRAGDAGLGFGVVAGEVKDLAKTTAHSTDQITRTVADLERDTRAVSGAITRMTDGIRGVDEAATALRQVADKQREVVEGLDRVVAATIGRIREMSAANERVDRRDHERVAVQYTASMLVDKSLHAIEVLDMSEGGVRVTTELGTPVILGSSVIVDLELDGVVVSATATAVFVEAGFESVLVGLRFDDLPGPTLDRVKSHLKRILDEQQAIEKATKAVLTP